MGFAGNRNGIKPSENSRRHTRGAEQRAVDATQSADHATGGTGPARDPHTNAHRENYPSIIAFG